ncbi:MAG TPA: hemerythrin domain-containing protein [Terriglobales bacterium]|nr:hemerythrin domain-containing protein [Terriglobales bacterium]
MLRDKNLVVLSHQHQRALALCVRMDHAFQAGNVDLDAWQSELEQQFASEGDFHLAIEEKKVFPVAARFPELHALVKELLAEHAMLREFFARAVARSLDAASLENYAEILVGHIRKEERQLFERMQVLMSPEELADVGASLAAAMKDSTRTCSTPPRPK